MDDPDALKVLVLKDTKSKADVAHAGPQKGTDDKRCAVYCIVEDVLSLGYAKVLVKSDNEPAVLHVLASLAVALRVFN